MQTATAVTLHAIPTYQKNIQRMGKTEIPVRNLSYLPWPLTWHIL